MTDQEKKDQAAGFAKIAATDYSKPENQISEEDFKKASTDTTEDEVGITKVLPLSGKPRKK
jgi:hypothetical protein